MITDPTIYVKDVGDNLDECILVQQKVSDFDKGVVNLAKEFGTGTDMRFQDEAHVVIVTKHTKDTETIRQMISRGTRNLGALKGTIFTIGTQSDEKHLRQKLIDGSSEDMQDGATILKTLRTICLGSSGKSSDISGMVQASNGKWLYTKEYYLEKLSKDEKKRFEKAEMKPFTNFRN